LLSDAKADGCPCVQPLTHDHELQGRTYPHAVAVNINSEAPAFNDDGYCNRCYRSVVRPSVCLAHWRMHHAEAIGQNNMPFGGDICDRK